jgi:hypothetical protein
MNTITYLDKRRSEPFLKVVIPFLTFEEDVIFYPDLNSEDQYKCFTLEGNLTFIDRQTLIDHKDCLIELLAAPNGTL